MKAIAGKIDKVSKKEERALKVLIGLVDLYLATGKPIGSDTLKDAGFELLSSATIRNYFALLDEEGYLEKPHISGGRVPTPKALRAYAEECLLATDVPAKEREKIDLLLHMEAREVFRFLQESAELLSDISKLPAFLSAPRFDHDFITKVKLVPIDERRLLAVIATDFGGVETELFHIEEKLSSFSIKRIEEHFNKRLSGRNTTKPLEGVEMRVADTLYHEVMVRYIVGKTHFSSEEVYRTGFAKLLDRAELQEPKALASTLSLFENIHATRKLLKECMARKELSFWVGDDLAPLAENPPDCTVVAIPYKIGHQIVGAIGVVAPLRINYKHLFALLRTFEDEMSRTLTKGVYKYKIQYTKAPQERELFLEAAQLKFIEHKR